MALIDNEELSSGSEIDAEDFKQQQQDSQIDQQQQNTQQMEQTPEIPEKYKGKNLEDIVRIPRG